jgi:hypothetical protein
MEELCECKNSVTGFWRWKGSAGKRYQPPIGKVAGSDDSDRTIDSLVATRRTE